MPSAVNYPTRTSNDTLSRTIGKVESGQSSERHTFSEQEEYGNEPRRRKKKRQMITVNTTNTKYELIRRAVEEIGMVQVRDDESSFAYMIWHDSAIQSDRVQELHSYQRINHFLGMGEICRKDYLARNMAKMNRSRPEEYNFTPRTWILPSEYNLLLMHWKEMKRKNRRPLTFIMKPANGAMGNGIHLFRNPERLIPHELVIVQEYLERPFLLDGFKCDLRIYALITHCDPLRVFLYQDGLVRLSTEKYASPSDNNVDSLYMHLTNYSVNKNSEKFERHAEFDKGSKRSIKSLMRNLKAAGYDTNLLWRNIADLIVKTLIVSSPHLLHAYRMCRPGQLPHSNSVCFEVLGFDVFLDRKLKPWLLEVNRAPSFGGDEKLDQEIKGGVIKDAIRLLNIRVSDKRKSLALQKSETQKRLFRSPHKRMLHSSDMSTLSKRKMVLNRRKEELKEKLLWARRDATRESYEMDHLGNYKLIFPAADKTQQKRYLCLLTDSFNLFLQSRSAPFQKSIIEQHYMPQKEEDILDMIEQCEAEEMGGDVRKPSTLSSMPVLTPPTKRNKHQRSHSHGSTSSSSSSSSEDEQEPNYGKHKQKSSKTKQSPEAERAKMLLRNGSSRPMSRVNSSRPVSARVNRSRTSTSSRPSTAKSNKEIINQNKQSLKPESITTKDLFIESEAAIVRAYINSYGNIGSIKKATLRISPPIVKQDRHLLVAAREHDEELTLRTEIALENTSIKFPGKTDKEAERILTAIIDNWKFHKPRVASYWLIKLDTNKRKKVIDIVRGNVRAVLQKVWLVLDVDSLKLMRSINRVFNRMHSNHGQGLWNCFTTSPNSWETILSKSSEPVSEVDLRICRRVVQLCKDCLLIVYQFAHDASIANVTDPPPIYTRDYTRHSITNASPYSLTHRPPHYMAPVFHNSMNTTIHVVSSRSDQQPLSLQSSTVKTTTSNILTQPAPARVRFAEVTQSSTLSSLPQQPSAVAINDLPKRFSRTLKMPTMYNGGLERTSLNNGSSVDHSAVLSSFQRAKTDVSLL